MAGLTEGDLWPQMNKLSLLVMFPLVKQKTNSPQLYMFKTGIRNKHLYKEATNLAQDKDSTNDMTTK